MFFTGKLFQKTETDEKQSEWLQIKDKHDIKSCQKSFSEGYFT